MNNLFYKIGVIFFSFVLLSILAFSAFFAYFKFNYPISYTVEIKKYSLEYGVDENLVRAIIKQESGYNNFAKSGKGAVGLMQIMPSTAEWIASELKMDDYAEPKLYFPDVNIRFGVFYLRYLFDKFETLDKVLFAYNAGEGTLIKLMETNNIEDILSLDFPQVSAYINNVKKYYKNYVKIAPSFGAFFIGLQNNLTENI